MKAVFFKETLRTIRHSAGRFLAIMIIVAVGCGFFAGLRMSGTGMRKTVDEYFDDTRFYDIQVTSTLGISQSTVDIVGDTPGVGELMCTKTVDVMADINDTNRTLRLTSFDVEKAKHSSSNQESESAQAPDQKGGQAFLNQPRLVEGRWPQNGQECVLLKRQATSDALGEHIKVLYGAQSLDGTLATKELTVVGFVNLPSYIDTATVAPTSLGSGLLWSVAYVSEDAFAADAPYSELSLSIEPAASTVFGTDAYAAEVQNVKDALTQKLDEIANARRAEVQASAQKTLDEKKEAYLQKKQEATEALTSAQEKLVHTQETLAASTKQITEAETLLSQKESELDQAYAAGLIPSEQYQAQTARLAAERQTLAEKKAQIEAGQKELAAGKKAYEKQKQATEKQLRDAQATLASAQKDIDTIAAPDVYVLDRDQNYGALSFKDDAARIDKIATVFPFFFFVVAALVALTTMMRMVEDDRTLIGTYKALGYSNAKIASKYLLYAALAATSGALLGIACMSQVLPAVILQAYSIIYAVPARPLPLPVELSPAVWAFVLGVGITLLATLYACVASFKETPATLMQPKAPKPGKRILLERIKPLWRRVSFSWKVTLRNIFRYKARFLMTVIGVAGCTMLLVTGFGVRDAVNDIIDNQFGSDGVTQFNTTIGLADPKTPEEAVRIVEPIETYLAAQEGVSDVAQETTKNMVAHTEADGNINHTLQVIVPQDNAAFLELNHLRNRQTQTPLPFDDSSVVLTEKLATTLGLKPGDKLALYEQDKIGNPVGAPVEVTLSGISENYLGTYLYMGKKAAQEAFGAVPLTNTLALNIAEDEEARTRIAEKLQTMENVDTVTFNDELIASYRNMLKSVDLVMVVLILSAMVLAFVVLYNLANINIAERIREIASLKVLGFTRREVAAYVFREILLIVLIGSVVGLVLGWGFESYVVVTAEVDRAMFGRIIHASSYLIAFGLTMLFSGFVRLSMLPKLHHIDMVESLKSVD